MLKAILLRKKIDDIKKAIDELRKKDTDFETREAELEAAIDEAVTEEDKSAVSEAIDAFESEKSENEKQISELETQLSDAEAELQEVEQRAKDAAKKAEPKKEQRKVGKKMEKRTYVLGMSTEQMQELCAREDVKDFLTRTREFARQERSVTGAELNIPDTIVGLMRQKAAETSKLMKYINMKYVSGSARQVVMGTVPEAVWTETIGKFNELSVSFNAVEVDGYKLGGFIAIPKSLLEDSD
ncbi:MAG: phage major capsid protein, partial [Christensenellales bacterium]